MSREVTSYFPPKWLTWIWLMLHLFNPTRRKQRIWHRYWPLTSFKDYGKYIRREPIEDNCPKAWLMSFFGWICNLMSESGLSELLETVCTIYSDSHVNRRSHHSNNKRAFLESSQNDAVTINVLHTVTVIFSKCKWWWLTFTYHTMDKWILFWTNSSSTLSCMVWVLLRNMQFINDEQKVLWAYMSPSSQELSWGKKKRESSSQQLKNMKFH